MGPWCQLGSADPQESGPLACPPFLFSSGAFPLCGLLQAVHNHDLVLWDACMFRFYFLSSWRIEQGPLGRRGFQVAIVVKNPLVNTGHARNVGSIPALGRFPGEGNGYTTTNFLTRKIEFLRAVQVSVQFSHSVVSDSLLPCPSPTPGTCSTCSNSSIESVMPSNHLSLCHPLLLFNPRLILSYFSLRVSHILKNGLSTLHMFVQMQFSTLEQLLST